MGEKARAELEDLQELRDRKKASMERTAEQMSKKRKQELDYNVAMPAVKHSKKGKKAAATESSESDEEMRIQKTRKQLERENRQRLEGQKMELLQQLADQESIERAKKHKEEQKQQKRLKQQMEKQANEEEENQRKRVAADPIFAEELMVDDDGDTEEAEEASNEQRQVQEPLEVVDVDESVDSEASIKKRSDELQDIRDVEQVTDMGIQTSPVKESLNRSKDELFEDVFANRTEEEEKGEVMEIPSTTTGNDDSTDVKIVEQPIYTRSIPEEIDTGGTDYFSEKHAKRIPVMDVTGQKMDTNSPQSPDSTNPPIVQIVESPYNPEESPQQLLGTGASPSVVFDKENADQDIDFNAYKDVVAFDDIMKSK